MSGPLTADVVVIGAGVQGLSAAYNIALGGRCSVIVVETRDRAGRGSSSRSGSMLMKSRENRPKIALSLYSYDRLMDFRAEFGEPLIFNRTGFLSVVTPALADRYEAEHALRREMGVNSERLSPQAIAELSPGLRTDDLAFGVLGPEDGEISADQILRAYENAARALGVAFHFDARALDIEAQNGRVKGVATSRGPIACDWIVNAAGADAPEVAGWARLDLPIANRRRSLFTVSCAEAAFHAGPMVEDAELEWYYRPLEGERVLVGMGLEPDAEATDGPNLAFLPEIRAAAFKRAPKLADFTVVGGTSGIRSLTPDILPIIGPVPGLAGYINSCGWGGEGIMHSPAGGALVADWINGARTCTVDSAPFLFSRFTTPSDAKGAVL